MQLISNGFAPSAALLAMMVVGPSAQAQPTVHGMLRLASVDVELSAGCDETDLARMATQGRYLVVSQPPSQGVLLFDIEGSAPRLLAILEGQGRNAAQFDRPGGVAIDSKRGLLYVSDTYNHRLQIFRVAEQAPAGSLLRFAKAIGRKGTGPAEFDRPGALALDAQGNLFAIDGGNARVQVFDANLRFVRAFGEAGDGDGQLLTPLDIAVAPAGDVVYVVDGEQRRIQAFDRDGRFLFAAGRGREVTVPPQSPGYFLFPFGVAIASDGQLYVTDCGDHAVQRFDARGRSIGAWGTFGGVDGQLNQPRQIAIDARGRVIVLDFVDRRGQLFSAGGGFLGSFRLSRSALGMPRVPSPPPR